LGTTSTGTSTARSTFAAVDPMTLHDVLSRLRTVKLEADARALAVEAVLAGGL